MCRPTKKSESSTRKCAAAYKYGRHGGQISGAPCVGHSGALSSRQFLEGFLFKHTSFCLIYGPHEIREGA